MKGLGRNLRALFVAFHLAAVSVAALPAPVGSGDRRAWKNPTVQAEISAWAKRLHIKPSRLEDRLFRLAGAWMKARERLLAPFQPYLDLTGCEQPWRMFVAAERFPTRLSIQAHTEGTGPSMWQTVFEERSDTYAWRRDFFDHDRVRGALLYYGWPAYRDGYERACTYFARAIFAEREGVDRVRCRMRRQRSPTPEEARAGTTAEVTWEQPYLVDRGKLAP